MTNKKAPRQTGKGKPEIAEATNILAAESLETQAVRIGSAENGSEAWHAMRAEGIGGSEIAPILGVSRWESAYTLWAKKIGAIETELAASEAMDWGNRLEPVILDKYEDENPHIEVIRNVGTWAHPGRTWQRANPDAIGINRHTGEPFIIEIKTAQFMDDWADGKPPLAYQYQVQWYLNVFGYEYAVVAVLFSGNKYREFEIIADPIAQSIAIDGAVKFMHCVDTATAPDWDGSNSTLETVRKMHPLIQDEIVEVGALGTEVLRLKKRFDEIETEFTKKKTEVLHLMGNAKTGTIDGNVAFIRQARGSGLPFLVIKNRKD